jgi:hypothetical protein
MAISKTYVCVEKFDVTKIFDTSYKSKVQDFMRKSATRYLEKSKDLTTKGDPKQEGFMLGGTLVQLLKGEKGGTTKLAAELNLHMSTWPKKSMFGFPKGKGSVDVFNEAKIEGDIEALLDGLLESMMKDVVREFEKRAKGLAKSK